MVHELVVHMCCVPWRQIRSLVSVISKITCVDAGKKNITLRKTDLFLAIVKVTDALMTNSLKA